MSEKLSIPKAAKLVGMSPRWLHGEIDAGRIPYTQPGKHRRVERADVERLNVPRNGAPVILQVEGIDPLKD